MRNLDQFLQSPDYIENGIAIGKVGEETIIFYRTSDGNSQALKLIQPAPNSRNYSVYRRFFNQVVPIQPYLLWYLIDSKIDPHVLGSLIQRFPSLKNQFSQRLDFFSWIKQSKKQLWTDKHLYSSWWIIGTRPLLCKAASDYEIFSLLVQNGANIHSTCGFDDEQKKRMLPDFVGSSNFNEIYEHREMLINHSTYRKRIPSNDTHKEERVLFYDKETHTVSMHEEQNISIQLKPDVCREELIRAHPVLLLYLSLNTSILDRENDSINASPCDNFTELLDRLLLASTYDISYNPCEKHVRVVLNLFSTSDNEVKIIDVPLTIPFSYENDNYIESIEFMGIKVSKPLDISMFFTYGYEFLSHQRPHSVMHIAVLQNDFRILKLLIEKGVDPLDHQTGTLIPPMTSLLLSDNTDELRFYLKRMSHRSSDFFSFCLINQYYQTARKVIIKTREPINFDQICKNHPLDVERLILTNAQNPKRQLHAGSEDSNISPKVYTFTKITEDTHFPVFFDHFRMLLQYSPELIYAFFDNRSLFTNFEKKITTLMLLALEKDDAMLLEFLVSGVTKFTWTDHLNTEAMRKLVSSCHNKKKLRKAIYSQYRTWMQKNSKSLFQEGNKSLDLTLPSTPTFITEDVCKTLLSQFLSLSSDVDIAWGNWLAQHIKTYVSKDSAFLSSRLTMDTPITSLSDSLFPIIESQKPILSITHRQWRDWVQVGFSLFSIHNRIAQFISQLNNPNVTEETYLHLVKSQKRYLQRTLGLQNELSLLGGKISQKIDEHLIPASMHVGEEKKSLSVAVTSFKEDEISSKSPGDEKRHPLPLPNKIVNKKLYIDLLQPFFTQEYARTPNSLMHIAINRFLILLMEIQEKHANNKLKVCPKYLPTVRNIYIHYSPFFSNDHILQLQEKIDDIQNIISDSEAGFSDIKHSVYTFISLAFNLSCQAFGLPYTAQQPIDDIIKNDLHSKYASIGIEHRVERLKSLLNELSISMDSLQSSKMDQKIIAMYVALEIGEHLKAEVRLLQTFGLHHPPSDFHYFKVLRGQLSHAFYSESSLDLAFPQQQSIPSSHLSSQIGMCSLKEGVVEADLDVNAESTALKSNIESFELKSDNFSILYDVLDDMETKESFESSIIHQQVSSPMIDLEQNIPSRILQEDSSALKDETQSCDKKPSL
ncbi:MAG: hypothetical protein VX112_04820 [Pseudomonadota bacterium]|nr:hypothetical protein [Pseudomonadota bacterium]